MTDRELRKLIREQKEAMKHRDRVFPEVIPKDSNSIIFAQKTIILALRKCGVSIRKISIIMDIPRTSVTRYIKEIYKD